MKGFAELNSNAYQNRKGLRRLTHPTVTVSGEGGVTDQGGSLETRMEGLTPTGGSGRRVRCSRRVTTDGP